MILSLVIFCINSVKEKIGKEAAVNTDELLTNMPSDLDKYDIDKDNQHILITSSFIVPFVRDKKSTFVTLLTSFGVKCDMDDLY